MAKTSHRNPPRLWVVGVTCLFAFTVLMAKLIAMDVGKTDPPEVWGAMIVSAAVLFGVIFLSFYTGSKRLKRKAREQEMKDDTNER